MKNTGANDDSRMKRISRIKSPILKKCAKIDASKWSDYCSATMPCFEKPFSCYDEEANIIGNASSGGYTSLKLFDPSMSSPKFSMQQNQSASVPGMRPTFCQSVALAKFYQKCALATKQVKKLDSIADIDDSFPSKQLPIGNERFNNYIRTDETAESPCVRPVSSASRGSFIEVHIVTVVPASSSTTPNTPLPSFRSKIQDGLKFTKLSTDFSTVSTTATGSYASDDESMTVPHQYWQVSCQSAEKQCSVVSHAAGAQRLSRLSHKKNCSSDFDSTGMPAVSGNTVTNACHSSDQTQAFASAQKLVRLLPDCYLNEITESAGSSNYNSNNLKMPHPFSDQYRHTNATTTCLTDQITMSSDGVDSFRQPNPSAAIGLSVSSDLQRKQIPIVRFVAVGKSKHSRPKLSHRRKVFHDKLNLKLTGE